MVLQNIRGAVAWERQLVLRFVKRNPKASVVVSRSALMADHHRDAEAGKARPDQVRVPPGAPEWVSPELIEQTLRIWQPYYDNQLVAEDALEIIVNVGRLVGALSGGDDMKQ